MDPETLTQVERALALLERYVTHLESANALIDKVLPAALTAIAGLVGAGLGAAISWFAARASVDGQLRIAREQAEREWRARQVEGLLEHVNGLLRLETEIRGATFGGDLSKTSALYKELTSDNLLRDSRWLSVDDVNFVEAVRACDAREREFVKTLGEGLLKLGDRGDLKAFKQFAHVTLEPLHQQLGQAVALVNRTARDYIFGARSGEITNRR